MPSASAEKVFCATACIARPVIVLFKNVCRPSTMRPANTSAPTSLYEMVRPDSLNTSSPKMLGNGCGSALYAAFTNDFRPIDRPSVATTTATTPLPRIGSTIQFLKAAPSTRIDKPTATINDAHNGKPKDMPINIAKAGSMTNSPCAKLMVPAACHKSVKPSAAIA